MDERELLVKAGQRLLSENLTLGARGNLSVLCADGSVCLTPSGMDYAALAPADMVLMATNGDKLSGVRKPTTEYRMHLAIYKARPDVKAIVHTHATASTTFACLGEGIPLLTDEAVQTLLLPVKTAAYALPGSEALASNCAEALGQGRAVLLRSHGAVCVGENIAEAFKTALVLERTCELYWRIASLGRKAQPISEENAEELKRLLDSYGQ